jgi:hypothetical protein
MLRAGYYSASSQPELSGACRCAAAVPPVFVAFVAWRKQNDETESLRELETNAVDNS